MQYIENIEELHRGIEEKDDCNDENNDKIADDEGNVDYCPIDETDTGMDLQTTEALDIIKSTPWFNQSSLNTVPGLNMEPVVEHSSRSSCWTDDMKKQNDDVLNDDELDESVSEEEAVLNPMEFISVHHDTNIDVSIE